ncbi:MAG: tetratricopeptide repeat protein, partial [Wenzhouxiangellaceae bacterium]
ARDELLPLFESCDHHPLLIQALAGEVAEFRPAPGNYAAWRRANPEFNPAGGLDLRQRQSHILAHALAGLDDKGTKVLRILAGFRMTTGYDTLNELLVGADAPCADATELDRTLTELEDRGLLGWERVANRYDLHPIVRGVVWDRLAEGDRQDVLEGLHAHFAAQPLVEDWREVESLADLEPAIELYDKLVGLGRYQQAFELFRHRLDAATLWRLSASRRRLELLRALFPAGRDDDSLAPPLLETARQQSYTLNALAQAYMSSGQPGVAEARFREAAEIDQRVDHKSSLTVDLANLSDALRISGNLHGAEQYARSALRLARKLDDEFKQGVSLSILGNALAARGEVGAADQALARSLHLCKKQYAQQGECRIAAYRAEFALRQGEVQTAHELAYRAWQLAGVRRHERDFIRAARLQGAAALQLGDFQLADERLHHALRRARAVDLAEEELLILVALAELHRCQGDPTTSRELLDPVSGPAERGPYPLFHADALNVLAQIERDAGNTNAAVDAATRAYELAWCDGPPYAYHWGLQAARAHLRELCATEPELPPFNPDDHEPMPEVEIDPPSDA